MIAAILLIACSVGVAGVFGLMWLWGYVRVCEPLLWVRGLELAISLGMLAYGIWYLFSGIRRHYGSKRR